MPCKIALKQTAHLAYVMQDSCALISDIKDAMQDCIETNSSFSLRYAG